jgi:hypothetical protein
VIRPPFGGDAERVYYQNVTLKGLIMRAYGVKEYRITGPDFGWIRPDTTWSGTYPLSKTLDPPVMEITDLKCIYGMSRIAMGMTSSPTVSGPPRAGTEKGPENMPGNTGGTSLFTALQERPGLKLEQRKTPADFLIVDRTEKVPVEN